MPSSMTVPAHIPASLIVDFDASDSAQFAEDPQAQLAWLHDRPDIFYTHRNGGHDEVFPVTACKHPH